MAACAVGIGCLKCREGTAERCDFTDRPAGPVRAEGWEQEVQESPGPLNDINRWKAANKGEGET